MFLDFKHNKYYKVFGNITLEESVFRGKLSVKLDFYDKKVKKINF